MAATGRHGSRRLLVQALYQRQLAGHTGAEIVAQFSSQKDFEKVDVEYFRRLLGEILADTAGLDALIAGDADRPVAQLDPVEHAILWLGLTELRAHPELPLKVVCSEGCRGICPACGKNRNLEACSCVAEGAPGPFDILKNLKGKKE
jgi:N utilization substance protein B